MHNTTFFCATTREVSTIKTSRSESHFQGRYHRSNTPCKSATLIIADTTTTSTSLFPDSLVGKVCQWHVCDHWEFSARITYNALQTTNDWLPLGPDSSAVKLNHGVSGAKGFLTTTLATASPHRRFLGKCEQPDGNVEKRYFNTVAAQMHAPEIRLQIQNRSN